MNKLNKTNHKVDTKRAIAFLKKEGIEINDNKAEEILEVMYFLARLIVDQNFKK
jgi:hypothetical protein